MGRIVTFASALNEALYEEMERDERVILLGEDIGVFGGVYKVTKGLLEKFGPSRVIDTPISEEGIIGTAIGMAIMGLKPVAEIMYPDFLPVCMNQLVNNAVKIKYMSNGKVSSPIVVRTCIIQGRGSGATHSQVLIPIFMHIPGFQVIAPSNPYDAKGLLKSAIRSERVTLFFENVVLYQKKGEIPDGEYTIPIGSAEIKRKGKDVTITCFSSTVDIVLNAALKLEKEGIECEVIDLRTLWPLDEKTIIESVKKTGRIVTVENSWGVCGVGSEIITRVCEKAIDYLLAPPVRISPPHIPEPASPALVKKYVLSEDKVIDGIKK
jgi:Pyruvate/2-oxoglutarate dehydrogenase complex, dehydrogenase (E1) component, eukaryotic type, beta subunit